MWIRKNKAVDESQFETVGKASSDIQLKEVYDSLFTSVLHLPLAEKCKKIAVTSAVYGEGKTSVSVNLALSLSANLPDKKVLLIDTDTRNSNVAKALKCENLGLSDFIDTDESNIPITQVNGLDVILSGNCSSNFARMVCSEKFSSLIASMENKYEYIVFDTAPVNVVSDTLMLEKFVNGYIIAAKMNYSTVNGISKAEEALKSINATVLGTVITDYKIKK